jgi:tRNA pseudouridine38-40 synthase
LSLTADKVTAERPLRLAAGVEYDGAAYSGWQVQAHAPSVQAELNRAISAVADASVECIGAGRTDSGVHASGQVMHFDAPVERSTRSWLMGINTHLPEDINLLWVRPVPEAFHARFSACARSYRYVILNRQVRSALERRTAWWVYRALDADRMHLASQQLLGEHDFSAFRASACQAKSPVKTMTAMNVVRRGDRIQLECTGSAFLHHMVRNIIGSLAKIGLGERPVEWLGEILRAQDRTLSGVTAPPMGLTLTRVDYPAELLERRVRRSEDIS